jgi:3-methyladenine DNA glycosylase AlkD
MMPGVTDLVVTLLERLDERIAAARDPVRAAAMAAYMRGQFPFAGVPAPALRRVTREVTRGLPAPGADELRTVALACWERSEREYHYFACGYLQAHGAAAGPAFLPVARTLLTTKPWWDTIDALATRFVGNLVRRHPESVATMDAWSTDDDRWLIRTALLHQLHYGTATDTDRLFGYCTSQAGHQDFFIRKAIGWALRHYARTDPDAVRAYLAAHRAVLSPLSVREASKHLRVASPP